MLKVNLFLTRSKQSMADVTKRKEQSPQVMVLLTRSWYRSADAFMERIEMP